MHLELLDQPEIYLHKQGAHFPLTFRFFAAIIGIFAGFLTFFMLYHFVITMLLLIAAVVFASSVFVIFAGCGIEVNLSARKYRDYWGPFGIKFGSWKDLPELDYISVFGAVVSQQISSHVSTTTISNEELQVNLIGIHRERINVFASSKEDKVLDEAWKLANYFNVGIYYSNGHDKKWLK